MLPPPALMCCRCGPCFMDLDACMRQSCPSMKGVCPSRQELLRMNQTYEAKFGHIFIICASGKSANEMLAALQQRQVTHRILWRSNRFPLR